MDMLEAALSFHAEGLCVIPIYERDKKPAVDILGGTWEQYQTRCSTENEISHWWNNGYGKTWNLGIVHGVVSGNYVTIDIDHDTGIIDELFDSHPEICKGRIEQSGSGQGFHIPLRVDTLPDFGIDQKHNRPRGNRTWKTTGGDVNLRCQFCQTLTPPSVHPSGGLYRYLQTGQITNIPTLDPLIGWLNELAPPPVKSAPQSRRQIQQTEGDDLLAAVKAAWPTCLTVFENFAMAGNIEKEGSSDLRLLGNGGLLVTTDLQSWYCFSDEIGGGIFEAWGYCRFGSAYDKHKQFRTVLVEMAQAAGIDIAKFYRKGDEVKIAPPVAAPTQKLWEAKYRQMWERVR
jgi:hypothetical protein